VITAALDRLRGLLAGPPDLRTPREIDEELSAELEFHIAALELEATRDGLSSDQAAAEARRRFGDPDLIRAHCRRIALEERIMTQRINVLLNVVLLLAVVVLGVQFYRAQGQSAAALDRLEKSVVALAAVDRRGENSRGSTEAVDAAGALRRSGMSGMSGSSSSVQGPLVYIDGDIRNPGAYAVPAEGKLRVTQLVASAGGRTADSRMEVSVHRHGIPVFVAEWGRGVEATSRDFVLASGDLVSVVRQERGSHEAEPDELAAASNAQSDQFRVGNSAIVVGEVDRPGDYEIPVGSATADNFIRAAIDSLDDGEWIEYVHLKPRGTSYQARYRNPRGVPMTPQNVSSPGWPGVNPGDILLVRRLTAEEGGRPEATPRAEVLTLALQAVAAQPAEPLTDLAREALQRALDALAAGQDGPPSPQLLAAIDAVRARLGPRRSATPGSVEPSSETSTAASMPRIPSPLDLSALSSMDRSSLQIHLAAVAKARAHRGLDPDTAERLRLEMAALMEALRALKVQQPNRPDSPMQSE